MSPAGFEPGLGRRRSSKACCLRFSLAFLQEAFSFLRGAGQGFAFLSTALGSHASRLHFCRKLVLAAPTNALPFLSTALLSQVPCAISAPSSVNEATTATDGARAPVYRLADIISVDRRPPSTDTYGPLG